MTATLRERIEAVTERRLSADEVAKALTDPLSAAEREDVRSLVRWLTFSSLAIEKGAYHFSSC